MPAKTNSIISLPLSLQAVMKLPQLLWQGKGLGVSWAGSQDFHPCWVMRKPLLPQACWWSLEEAWTSNPTQLSEVATLPAGGDVRGSATAQCYWGPLPTCDVSEVKWGALMRHSIPLPPQGSTGVLVGGWNFTFLSHHCSEGNLSPSGLMEAN